MGRRLVRGLLIFVAWVTLPFSALRPSWLLRTGLGAEAELIGGACIVLAAALTLWLMDRGRPPTT
jgi:hypothetical protein